MSGVNSPLLGPQSIEVLAVLPIRTFDPALDGAAKPLANVRTDGAGAM